MSETDAGHRARQVLMKGWEQAQDVYPPIVKKQVAQDAPVQANAVIAQLARERDEALAKLRDALARIARMEAWIEDEGEAAQGWLARVLWVWVDALEESPGAWLAEQKATAWDEGARAAVLARNPYREETRNADH